MSGRSTERLIEEILNSDPQRFLWYALTPIEESEHLKTVYGGIDPPPPAYTASLTPSTSTFNFLFPTLACHVQIEKIRFFGRSERDWHAVKHSTTHASGCTLRCRRTGAELQISWFPLELSPEIAQSLDSEAVYARLKAAGLSEEEITAVGIEDRFSFYRRILSDLITLPPNGRRSINSQGVRASSLLDLPLLLPFLGFRFDPEKLTYEPPHTDTAEFRGWLRRLLLEVEYKRSGDAVGPALGRFLEVAPVGGGTEAATGYAEILSADDASAYACLGATAGFDDERIWSRYLLASQQDPAGTAWYLDAASVVAEARQSDFLQMQVMSLVSLGTPLASAVERQLSTYGVDARVAAQLSSEEVAELALTKVFDAEQLVRNVLVCRRHYVAAAAATATEDLGAPPETPAVARRNDNNNDSQNDSEMAAAAGAELTSEEEEDPETAALEELYSFLAQPDPSVLGEDPERELASFWGYGGNVLKLEMLFVLRALAFDGGRSELIPVYEQYLHQNVPPLAAAFKTLGVEPGLEHTTTDNALMAMFWAQAIDAAPERVLELRAAVRAVAKARHSIELFQFLGTAEPSSDDDSSDSSDDEQERLPPGLWNIGNTCYLNSLLQFYYSVPEVRRYALEAAEKETTKASMEETANAGSDPAGSGDDTIGAADDTVAIDTEGTGTGDKTVGGESETNVGAGANATSAEADGDATDSAGAGNAAAAAAGGTSSGKHGTIGGRKISPNEVTRSHHFVALLGQLFGQIGSTRRSHVVPSDILAYMALIRPQEDANAFVESGPSYLRDQLGAALQRQQDVTECIENVLDQLEATMSPLGTDSDGEQLDLVKTLFYGSTLQALQRVADGGNRRTKTERFSSLLIDAGDRKGTLYSALDRAFADDVLELEEGLTRRTLRIKSLPQILQIQIQRVQFDRESYMPYKNTNPVVFDDVVYMDRYLVSDEGSELAKLQEESKQLDAKVAELQAAVEELLRRKESVDASLEWLALDSESEQEDEDVDDDAAAAGTVEYTDVSSNSGSDSSHSGDSGHSGHSGDSGESSHTGESSSHIGQSSSHSDFEIVESESEVEDSTDVRSDSNSSVDVQQQQQQQQRPVLSPFAPFAPVAPPVAPSTVRSAPLTEQPEIEFMPQRSTLAALQRCSDALGAEVEEHRARITEVEERRASLFARHRQYGYRLHALFIHKGDASYGHYWIYIRDASSGRFLKYNDEYVSEASDAEVFDFSDNIATPYFLVYLRDEPTHSVEAVEAEVDAAEEADAVTGETAGTIKNGSETGTGETTTSTDSAAGETSAAQAHAV